MPEMKDSGIEWIGEIPKDWEIVRIKEKYQFETGFTPDTAHSEYYEDEQGYEWVTIADLNKGTISRPTKALISRNYVNARNKTPIPSGSLLYSFKLSVGQTAIVDRPVYTNEAIASFLPKKDICLRFLMYSSMFIEYNGNTNIYGAYILNQQLINNSRVVFPDLDIQEKIADFLDFKCAEIDALTADIEKEIEVLEEYKKSVITEAVTKGLDSNEEMKDSGVEWIGEIPADWEVMNIKRIYDRKHHYPIGDGDHGLIKPADYKEEGVPYIRVQNLGFCTSLKTDNIVYISPEKNNQIKNSSLHPNDVLFAKTGATIGKTGIIPDDMPIANTTSHVGKITVDKIYDSRFVYYALSSFVGYKQFWDIASMKSTRPELSIDETKRIFLVMPTQKEEQVRISSFLDEKCLEIDAMVSVKKEQLSVLADYKKSLIYEYVTGKKEAL